MKHGSLFSGIGGFDLAAQWMGWENVFHCEWNEFGQKVLKHYWPKAISYHDITKTDFTIHRGKITVLTGGFPCQPYSTAGKRLGKEDERHLWPEMLRAIREIQPRWVVGENVFGLVNWNGGLVFEEVQADLEAEGYEVQPFILPAAAVNAPHRRDRVWFVAYSNRSNDGRITRKDEGESREKRLSKRNKVREPVESNNSRTTPNSKLHGHATAKGRESNGEAGQWGKEGPHSTEQSEGICKPRQLGCLQQDAPNTSHQGLQGGQQHGTPNKKAKEQGQQSSGSTSKRYQVANWEQFPTQSPICGGDDGLPTQLDGITFPKWRNESIKAYGNAVVPQVVYQIFKAIELYENDPIN